MNSSATSSDSAASEGDSDGQLSAVVRSVSTLARRMMVGVAVLASASAGAGGLLWWLLWWPLRSGGLFLLGAVGSLVVLFAPAIILGLFYQGLRELRALPDRVRQRTDRTLAESAEAVQTVKGEEAEGWIGRGWGLLRRVWALRKVLLDNRALLVRYGALLRFVTPGFVLLVVGATVVSLLLIPVAVGSGLLSLLW